MSSSSRRRPQSGAWRRRWAFLEFDLGPDVSSTDRPLRDSDDQCCAGTVARLAVSVGHAGIEVDRVAGFQFVAASSNRYHECSGEQVQMFGSRVSVRLQFLLRDILEVCIVSIELSRCRPVVQGLEKICDLGYPRALWKPLAISLLCQRHDMSLPFIGEEVIQADIEHGRDACQGGQSGIELAALELG